jgi:hypothetical protein
MAALAQHQTCELKKLPTGVKTVNCGWVFDLKLDKCGNILRFKARLVAKGYSQQLRVALRHQPGVDYLEGDAPLAANETFLALVSKVASKDLELHQVDIKTAFLHGRLEEEVWMEQLPGYKAGAARVKCKLLKALWVTPSTKGVERLST